MFLSSYTKGLQFFYGQEIGTIYCMLHIINDNYICKKSTSYIWYTLQNIIFLKIGDETSPELDAKCWTQRILLTWFPEMLQLWTCTDILVMLWLLNLIDSVQKHSAASGSLHFQLCTVSIKIPLEFVWLYLPYAVIKIMHHMMHFFKRQT